MLLLHCERAEPLGAMREMKEEEIEPRRSEGLASYGVSEAGSHVLEYKQLLEYT